METAPTGTPAGTVTAGTAATAARSIKSTKAGILCVPATATAEAGARRTI